MTRILPHHTAQPKPVAIPKNDKQSHRCAYRSAQTRGLPENSVRFPERTHLTGISTQASLSRTAKLGSGLRRTGPPIAVLPFFIDVARASQLYLRVCFPKNSPPIDREILAVGTREPGRPLEINELVRRRNESNQQNIKLRNEPSPIFGHLWLKSTNAEKNCSRQRVQRDARRPGGPPHLWPFWYHPKA